MTICMTTFEIKTTINLHRKWDIDTKIKTI